MGITIIIKDGKPKGKTRSAIDRELYDVGWGSTFKNDGDRDKCEFIERKLKKNLGVDDAQVTGAIINRIDRK